MSDVSDVCRSVMTFCEPEALCALASCSMSMCRDVDAEVRRRVAGEGRVALLPRLTQYQRTTLGNVRLFRPVLLRCLLARRCYLCAEPYRGGLDDAFGLPAHARCIKENLTPEFRFPLWYDTKHVLRTLPFANVTGYSHRMGVVDYRAVWRSDHPRLPWKWTLEAYVHDNEESLLRRRLELRDAAERAEEAKAEARRAKRRKTYRERNPR